MTFVVQTAARRMLACASAAAALACALAPASAQAGSTFGSAAIFSNRACTAPAGTSCDLSAPRTSTTIGGMGAGLAGGRDFGGGATGQASVSFGPGYLPTVRVGSTAGAATRTGASATAFRSFTYTGTSAIALAFWGNLDFTTSGDDGPNLDGYGDGSLNAVFGVMPISSIASYGPGTSAGAIISNNHLNFPDCGDGALGAEGVSTQDAGATAGFHSRTIGLGAACGGVTALIINPGDSFVVVATLQAISNRGGFVDAMHTFSVEYDFDHTYYAGTTDKVDPSVFAAIHGGVPEPASWALMMLGFGATGAALRRRKAMALTEA